MKHLDIVIAICIVYTLVLLGIYIAGGNVRAAMEGAAVVGMCGIISFVFWGGLLLRLNEYDEPLLYKYTRYTVLLHIYIVPMCILSIPLLI